MKTIWFRLVNEICYKITRKNKRKPICRFGKMFANKQKEGFTSHATLLLVIEYVLGWENIVKKRNIENKLNKHFSKLCINMYEVPTLGCEQNWKKL